MQRYELVLVLPAELEKEASTAEVNKIKQIVDGVGAKITKEESWGVKKMAYEIKHQGNGLYLIWELQIEDKALHELRRLLNFEQNLLRYLLLKVTNEAK
jgi:small subunit ribosomal protein S6